MEFALQACINCSKDFDSETVPLARSLAGTGDSRVEVNLSDGTANKGEMWVGGQQKLITSIRPHQNFAMAPFVLRRSNILHFWDTPEVQRQKVFFDYFRSSRHQEWAELPTIALRNLEQESADIRQKRIGISKKIAVRMNIDVEEVPTGQAEFEEFVRDNFYEGLTIEQRQQAERCGKSFRIPKRLFDRLQEMREANRLNGIPRRKIRELKQENNLTA